VNGELKQRGYLLGVGQHPLKAWLFKHMQHSFNAFASTWGQLCPDPFLRDEGGYRYRRYSVFNWDAGKLSILPPEPHFQSSYYNGLHGGFNRFFFPWVRSAIVNPVLYEVIHWATKQFSPNVNQQWRIQAHQFRVVANNEQAGKPTPEGVHKDGADFILIMLLQRHNVQGGVSHIYDNHKDLLGALCLQEPGDLLLIDDEKVYHGVSDVYPIDNKEKNMRDVMVLTFHSV
jgi:hypothetical protein